MSENKWDLTKCRIKQENKQNSISTKIGIIFCSRSYTGRCLVCSGHDAHDDHDDHDDHDVLHDDRGGRDRDGDHDDGHDDHRDDDARDGHVHGRRVRVHAHGGRVLEKNGKNQKIFRKRPN